MKWSGYIYENSHTDFEREKLFTLLLELNRQVPAGKRLQSIDTLIDELQYFERHGHFSVKRLSTALVSGNEVMLLGANNTIYLLQNIPTDATLKEIAELLAEQFPEDFIGTRQLAS